MTNDGGERLLERIKSDNPPSSPALAPEFDATRYLPSVADCELTEAEKEEFLRVLWQIMCRFVELGFECDVCQLILNEDKTASDPESSGVLLEYSSNIKDDPTDVGKGERQREE